MASLLKKCVVFMLFASLGCSAQPNDPALNQRIERHVRATYSVPDQVEVAIGERKPSEFPNYDQVVITFSQGERKQSQDFLISKDGKTLVRFARMDITKDPYAEIMQKIDVQGRPFRGSKDAKVTIVNYDDFQCTFCARMHQTLMNDIAKSYGDKVQIIYKDFPLESIHPWAVRAAVNANCLGEQNNDAYWEFVDFVHYNQQEIGRGKPLEQQLAELDKAVLLQGQKSNLDLTKLQSCVKAQSDAKVRASAAEGMALGVEATPTLFINGRKVAGAIPAPMLRNIIDRALSEAGQTPPTPAANPQKPGGAAK